MESELTLSDGQATDSSGDDSFDEGPTTYHEWRSFVLKTYLNGADSHLHQSTASKPCDRFDLKAKEARKAIQPPPNTQRAEDNKRFKVPVKDASGNPIVNLQSTPNPFAKSTSSAPVTSHHSQNNSSMANSLHYASSNYYKPNRGQIPTSKPTPSSRVTKSSSYPENTKPVGKPNPSAQLKVRSDVFWSLNSAAKLLHVKAQLDEPSRIYVDKLVKNNGVAQQEIQKLKKEKQDLINAIKMVERIISDPQLTLSQSPTV